MSERFSFEKTRAGAKFIDAPDDGHGAYGRVKKASFWGREVKVQGHDLNAGSLIDFLNTQHGATLEKGWLFGLGGSSNDEIQTVFDTVYPVDTAYKARLDEAKKSFVNMKESLVVLPKEQNMKYIGSAKVMEGITVLTPERYNYSPSSYELFEGIFLMKGLERTVLHICLKKIRFKNDAKDPVNKILDPLLNDAMEKLAELDLPMPTHFCCDYDHLKSNYVEQWQKANGRVFESLIQERLVNSLAQSFDFQNKHKI